MNDYESVCTLYMYIQALAYMHYAIIDYPRYRYMNKYEFTLLHYICVYINFFKIIVQVD